MEFRAELQFNDVNFMTNRFYEIINNLIQKYVPITPTFTKSFLLGILGSSSAL